MQRIGVISDTHLSESGSRGLPRQVLSTFEGVDLIVHAGDFTSRRAMDLLTAIAPLMGVRGNNDPAHLELPRTRRVAVEGCTFGLCHGDRALGPAPRPLSQFRGNGGTAGNALTWFEHDDDVCCIIFGHSHQPMCEWLDHASGRILFLNPGSPTDRRLSKNFGCALITVNDTRFDVEPLLW